MGWKSRLGGVAKKAGGVALQGATGGLASALVQEHGEELGGLIEKIDNIADVVEDHALIFKRLDSLEVNCMTQHQASRLEAKIDKVLRLLEQGDK